MQLVQGATYEQGAVAGDSTSLDDERPRLSVFVPTFYMDLHEVTRRQFGAFVAETGYSTEVSVGGTGMSASVLLTSGRANRGLTWRQRVDGSEWPLEENSHPVAYVSHKDAHAYATWAGARLPTEGQFEFVLRDKRVDAVYPWGDDLVAPKNYANLRGAEFYRAYPALVGKRVGDYEDAFAWSAPVMSMAPNRFGLYDISGNVAEWCRDDFRPYGEQLADEGDEAEPIFTGVLRGGSWFASPSRLRASWRGSANADGGRPWWGFRCVVEVPAHLVGPPGGPSDTPSRD